MRDADDNDFIFHAEDCAPIPNSQAEPAAPSAAEGAHVADAACGEAIQRIQDALLVSPRQVFQVSRSLAGVADSHG